MTGLLWKLPLVLILAVLAAAANLASYVNARLQERTPVALAPALRAPSDGLVRAKLAALRAGEVAALRDAVRAFEATEGRAPQSLRELTATGYLRSTRAPHDLHGFSYDPATLTVTADIR